MFEKIIKLFYSKKQKIVSGQLALITGLIVYDFTIFH